MEDWEVLDLLSRLAAKSLIVVEPPEAGQVDYRLLESIRSYARDRLAQTPGETETLAVKHRGFFLALAEEAAPELLGANAVLWLNLLEWDGENLRSTLTFSRSEGGDSLPRLAGALSRFWYGRSFLSEGMGWLKAALAQEPKGAVLGKVLNGLGMLAWRGGEYEEARAYHERDLTVQRRLENSHGIARALGNLCILAIMQQRFDQAETYGRESLVQYQRLGNRNGTADMLLNLGIVALSQENYAEAEQLYREALAEYRTLLDAAGQESALFNLGNLFLQQGRHDRAQPYFRDSLEAQRTLGDKYRIAEGLVHLAECSGTEGNHAHVCILQAASERIERENSLAIIPDFDAKKTLAQSRSALGEEQFQAFWSQGARMDTAQSIDFVLEHYAGLG